eukprot:360622-Chlamydomonas_euryale.AAC.12
MFVYVPVVGQCSMLEPPCMLPHKREESGQVDIGAAVHMCEVWMKVTKALLFIVVRHQGRHCKTLHRVLLSQSQSQSYRKWTREGYACVERSMAEGIKQRAGHCVLLSNPHHSAQFFEAVRLLGVGHVARTPVGAVIKQILYAVGLRGGAQAGRSDLGGSGRRRCIQCSPPGLLDCSGKCSSQTIFRTRRPFVSAPYRLLTPPGIKGRTVGSGGVWLVAAPCLLSVFYVLPL